MHNHITPYNKKLNLEFYHIPKNAMTTVMHGIEGFEWTDVDKVPSNATTFCVLRHPIKRAVSSFEHFVFSDGFKNVPQQTLRKLKQETLSEMKRLGFTKNGFEKFISEIESNRVFNEHHRPQYEFLDGYESEDPKIAHRRLDNINFFCSHENINQDLKDLSGINVPHLGKGYGSKNTRKKILEFAHNQMRDRLKKIYQRDFDLYKKHIEK